MSQEQERLGRIHAERRLTDIRNALSGVSWSQRISRWQVATFGLATPQRALERAAEEWEELCESMSAPHDAHELIDEARDVVICLAALVAALGSDLHAEVQDKMNVNEFERIWHSNGDGTGYHIKPKVP